MKRTFKFNNKQDIPIVVAEIYGKTDSCVARLVFDTGAAVTQFDTPLIDALGYSAAEGEQIVSAYGPAGEMQTGYSLKISKIEVLGITFEAPSVAVYDFDNLSTSKIDGLLGFDLIKQLKLEMDGPEGELTVHL